MFYRAPELICGAVHYDGAIDLWSAGCLIAQLILGRPIFVSSPERAGAAGGMEENGAEQLMAIVEVLGMPTPEDIVAIRGLDIRIRDVLARAISDSGSAHILQGCLGMERILGSAVRRDTAASKASRCAGPRPAAGGGMWRLGGTPVMPGSGSGGCNSNHRGGGGRVLPAPPSAPITHAAAAGDLIERVVPLAADLVNRLVVFNPLRRAQPCDLLDSHPFLRQGGYHSL